MAHAPYGPPEWPPSRNRYGRAAVYPPTTPPPWPVPEPEAPSRRRTPARHRSAEWPTVRDRRQVQVATREDKSRWHWLLIVPIALPLMPFLYNRIDPTLLGLPFFYWCQLGFAFLASGVIAFVHHKVR
ncbi:DUF3311 domain-containing protein [Actinoplanes solisilvae]|uniref:DUF3311 domain-containing protein n=1 Tax=Actinoplanes solisilvae TaxID=2486853 RepID=UPI000FD92C22|nr:DUF3311 domain-containing protein [Actinoplanes solisilvae]